ncbi:COQ7 protein [Athelia psychrophila]|uniref:5-demethoxyubiquinone hydroxylase, mitochondrial n=1 Tax=Athelia psychrophila TaxID=1759441 RepID=A0A166NB58_9AGAM|nr:COQ7 protein [Fibularhizoctonia sp. CBS 109695]
MILATNGSSRCFKRVSLVASRSVRTQRPSSSSASSAYTGSFDRNDPSTSTSPVGYTPDQRNILDIALRVDQAGEVAANWIYKGQMAVLGRDAVVGPLIQEMWDQEKKHLVVMDRLLAQHRVRPTLLTGIAQAAGFGVGAVTALMGKEAAMACTEAVETVIGEHYDAQLKELDTLPSHPSISLLKNVVRELRDDELEHLDIAVANFSQRAPAHALLSTVIGGGCLVAIELCKRI